MNKGQIRTHFIALLNRTDCTNALADTFIDMAMGRIMRTLRIPSMEKQQTYAVSTASGITSVVLPDDLLETIDIFFEGRGLVRVPRHEMVEYQREGTLGAPVYFPREQGTFLLYPMPTSGTVYINYYAELPALSADSESNLLTILASDAITYTALGYAADYFLDERGQMFDAKGSLFVQEIQDQADKAESSGGTQVMRPTGTFSD